MCIDDIVEEDETLWRLEDKVKVDCYDHILVTRELDIPIPVKATNGEKQPIKGKYFRYETVLVPVHYGLADYSRANFFERYEMRIEARMAHKSYLTHIKRGGVVRG